MDEHTRPHYERSALLTIDLQRDFLIDSPYGISGRQLQRLGPTEGAMFTPRWNAFYDTGLDDHLRQIGVDTVVVAGCNYPNCPRGTLLGASERDYRAVLVKDAVSEWNEHASTELDNLGVVTATTSEVLTQFGQTANVAAPA